MSYHMLSIFAIADIRISYKEPIQTAFPILHNIDVVITEMDTNILSAKHD